MPKEELQKHTLLLHAGDYETLQSMYPDIGASPVIRRIVRAFINKIEAQGNETPEGVDVKI